MKYCCRGDRTVKVGAEDCNEGGKKSPDKPDTSCRRAGIPLVAAVTLEILIAKVLPIRDDFYRKSWGRGVPLQ